MTAVPKKKYTLEEYFALDREAEGNFVYYHGEIIEMSVLSPSHAAGVKRISKLFNCRVADDVIVSIQDPIQLNDLSQPQLDIALLKPRDDFYKQAHPKPEDLFLLGEVAESSSVRDDS